MKLLTYTSRESVVKAVYRSVIHGVAWSLLILSSAVAGCSSANTWRADGIGVQASASGVMVIYGEIDRVPPGGYYRRERTVDLRPVWQTWLTSPDTNCLATSVVILDATRVAGSAMTNSVTISRIKEGE